MLRVREGKNYHKPFHHLEMVIQMLLVAIDNLEREMRRIRYANKPKQEVTDANHIGADDIARAKEVPIETLYTGKLKVQGRWSTGLCPFHNERSESFTLYLDQNTFFCYGCSAGRDAIDFVIKRDNVDFHTAVRTLLNK